VAVVLKINQIKSKVSERNLFFGQGSSRNQLNDKCSERILIIGMVLIASSTVTKVRKGPSPLAMVLIKPTHQPWFLYKYLFSGMVLI
jgi:hypothetical protein